MSAASALAGTFAVTRFHAVTIDEVDCPTKVVGVDLAAAVDTTAEVFKRTRDCDELPSNDDILRDFGSYLKILARDDHDQIPSLGDLDLWFSKHSEKGARGKITTTGIVARIMQHGQFFGTRGEDLARTLGRVDAILGRARRTEQKHRKVDKT